MKEQKEQIPIAGTGFVKEDVETKLLNYPGINAEPRDP